MVLCLNSSCCIASHKSPAGDPGQHSRQDGEYSTIDSHIILDPVVNVKTLHTPPLYAHFAKAVICQSGSLMNPVSWSALKPVFPGAQQEDDQPFPDTDRSALKGVLKHWAVQYYFCAWQTRGHITGLTLIWSNRLLFSSLAWMSSLKVELLPRKRLCTLNLRCMRAASVLDVQFSCNLV